MGNFQARQKRQKLIVGLFLAVWGFITFVPFIWMILSSFKTNPEIMQLNPSILPKNFTFDNFIKLFRDMNFAVYLKNTLIITGFSFFGLFLNAMAGYGFAKFKFKGKEK